jgi:hypothetical protein
MGFLKQMVVQELVLEMEVVEIMGLMILLLLLVEVVVEVERHLLLLRLLMVEPVVTEDFMEEVEEAEQLLQIL